ncbi:NAD-dependent epimerase/dehydratase family protein [Nocardia sp. PE-7]|uniref:NAD-dependent epimerase/dehydratase family protein n=1 Tax=Nocardia sp. PE-7 TaxID=3058426 RepID=UPI00265AFA79|nr:NAD-dependent epimerase/dehydratase family protein [Nocardia sp. PE-7]WKG08383.1 NAD-dependent epimerase/dehydratase family protein [Nocardia sp. PE-7]
MTVLVTGATGFVGGAIVRGLVARGVPVRAMVRDAAAAPEGVEVAVADLGDTGALARAVTGVRAVVHAAALLGEFGRPAEYFAVNVAGTDRLVQEAAAAGVRRFVFIGSPSALMVPDGGDQVGIDETVPYPERFLNSYCETKAVAEQLVLAADAPGFTTCSLRPRAVWGPGDRRGPIVQILAKLRAGRLPDLSGGRDVRASLCYIDHLVDAVGLALEAENVGGRAYFVADAEPVSVWPTLDAVAERFALTGPSRTVPALVLSGALAAIETLWRIPAVAQRWTPPLSRYAVALVTRSATYDLSRAERELGYRPDVPFETGLDNFHRWVAQVGGLDRLLEDL